MKKKYITAFLIFSIFLLIYFLGSFSKITFGDSIEYAYNAELGVYTNNVTPLSHYLYTNATIFIKNIFHLDSIFACKLMSVVPGALSIAFLYLLIKEFITADWAAVTSSIVFGFSFTFWRSAGNLEVYTFHALWVIVFFLSMVKSFNKRSITSIISAGFFLGISLYAHIQSIILIPAYLFFLYQLRKEKKAVALSFTIFMMMVTGIIFINKSAGISPEFAVLTNRGPWIRLTLQQSFQDLVVAFGKSIFYLIYNFNVFIIIGVIGIKYFYKNHHQAFPTFFIAGFCSYNFATFYKVSDNYVYFISFYFLVALLIAWGLQYSIYKKWFQKYSYLCLIIPAFYFMSYKMAFSIPIAQNFHEKKEYKGGLRYYLLPWMNNNVGCLEFLIEKRQTDDWVDGVKAYADKFIELRLKYQSLSEIKKL